MQCREELTREVYKLGGVPAETGVDVAEFEKAWQQIRAALNANDHKTLLESCYLEEFMTYKSYEYSLKYYQDQLTSQQLSLFNRQYDILKEDHQKVKNLRSVLLSAA
jgi:uncharacterized protein (TIGR02284 family)